jgi:hypothetical protein
VVAPNGGETYAVGGSVDVNWSASQGIGVMTVDLDISRSGPAGAFETIALGVPNTGTYSWALNGPPTTDAYLRVTAHDQQGHIASDLSDAAFTINPVNLGVDDPTVAAFMLSPVAPNPTVGSAHLEYTVARTARVRLTVSDLSGRTVFVLADGTRTPGRHRVQWDFSKGRGVAPGVYLLRYEAPGTSIVRRIVLIR